MFKVGSSLINQLHNEAAHNQREHEYQNRCHHSASNDPVAATGSGYSGQIVARIVRFKLVRMERYLNRAYNQIFNNQTCSIIPATESQNFLHPTPSFGCLHPPCTGDEHTKDAQQRSGNDAQKYTNQKKRTTVEEARIYIPIHDKQ